MRASIWMKLGLAIGVLFAVNRFTHSWIVALGAASGAWAALHLKDLRPTPATRSHTTLDLHR
jgi:hypothetical protein